MLITLTSDMGLKDYYVAAIKGSIYNQLPEAKVVDISHDIFHHLFASTLNLFAHQVSRKTTISLTQ